MSQRAHHACYLAVLLAFSFLLRRVLFQGFVLGDDPIEWWQIQGLANSGLSFNDQLDRRLFGWLPSFLAFKLFGVSEWAFFLPTWLFSASLSAIGYWILIDYDYSPPEALGAGLLIGSAPFEVMIGTLRANDLFLEWFLAGAFLVMARRTERDIPQGLLLAVLLWCAFYVKLWAVYFLPIVALFYVSQWRWQRRIHGLLAFLLLSAALHASMCAFWRYSVGSWLPFVHDLPGHYPVARRDLGALFMIYPAYIFEGSEFHTSLFGSIPYLFLGLFLWKIGAALTTRGRIKVDRLDIGALCYFWVLILLLNFVPNSFHLDQYYSAPRIFRYLAPISFPMVFLTGKWVIDLLRVAPYKRLASAGCFGILLALNLWQSAAATGPGRLYRSALFQAMREIRTLHPPRLVVESWLSGFVGSAYKEIVGEEVQITTKYQIYRPEEYMNWVREEENGWEPGTVLLTGINSNVYYTCYECGLRLNYARTSFSAAWVLHSEGVSLDYLPNAEPVRVWILRPQANGMSK